MRRILGAVLVLTLLLASVVEAATGIDRKRFPEVHKGEHFQVHYTRTGPDAVELAYVERTLQAAETAYQRLVVEAGFRPPRVLPVPIVLRSLEEGLGGRADASARGFAGIIELNAKMTASLEDVVSHEFVHLLQSAYDRGLSRPKWAIEGTATVGSFYALGTDAPRFADWSHLGQYWQSHTMPMKERDYDPSLFWLLTAERHGGADYLRRLFEWSEDVEWERAAQLAAIASGASAETTFDSLWRASVVDMLSGQMPKGYVSAFWFNPTRLSWDGRPTAITRGKEQSGVSVLGRPYAYFEPLLLPPYSFDLIVLENATPAPMAVTVTADPSVVEGYLISPGPAMEKRLRGEGAPANPSERLPVPSGDGTVGAPLVLNEPVAVTAPQNAPTLLLLMRLGAWGNGTYSLKLQPAPPGAAAPSLVPLDQIPHGPNTAGSPPPLTAAELTALKSGFWIAGSTPLEGGLKEAGAFRTVEVSLTEAAATVNGEPVPMKTAGVADAKGGPPLIPFREVGRILGFTVAGNRVTNGGQWVEVTPGTTRAVTHNGPLETRVPAVAAGDDLLVDLSVFSLLGCGMSYNKDRAQLTYPRP